MLYRFHKSVIKVYFLLSPLLSLLVDELWCGFDYNQEGHRESTTNKS